MSSEYMLFIRNRINHLDHLSPEQNEAFLKACKDYIDQLMKEGKLKAAQPLVKAGKMVSRPDSNWTNGPYNESNEVIVGYYHVLADSEDDAIAIARRNPEFEYTRTARIEVRPIKTKEESTGFKYPDKNK